MVDDISDETLARLVLVYCEFFLTHLHVYNVFPTVVRGFILDSKKFILDSNNAPFFEKKKKILEFS